MMSVCDQFIAFYVYHVIQLYDYEYIFYLKNFSVKITFIVTYILLLLDAAARDNMMFHSYVTGVVRSSDETLMYS